MSLAIGVMSSMQNKKYLGQLEACLQTWVLHAAERGIPVFFFCGKSKASLSCYVPRNVSMIHYDVEDDIYSATQKQWYGFSHMLKETEGKFSYYAILGTDNYINIDLTLACLSKYDAGKEFLLGGYGQCRTIDKQVLFPSGGGGVFLSRSALEKIDPLVEKYIARWERRCRKYQCLILLQACDVSLADACWHLNIPLIIERHFYPCSWRQKLEGRSFPLDVEQDKICVHHYLDREEMLFYHKYKQHAEDFIELERKVAFLPSPLFSYPNIYAQKNWIKKVLYAMIMANMSNPLNRTLYVSDVKEKLIKLASKFDIVVKQYDGSMVDVSVGDKSINSVLYL